MQALTRILQFLAAPLVRAASALAVAGHRPSDFAIAAFAVSAGLIGLVCSYWAAWAHARLANYRLAARQDRARSDGAIRFRDALLAGGRETVAVLGTDTKDNPPCVGGNGLLQAGMSGPDAARLAGALDGLLKNGTQFDLRVRTAAATAIAMRGGTIGRRAVVFLRELGSVDLDLDYRAVLDALPAPVWLRGQDLALRWGNRAFLAATGSAQLQDALALGATIERSECELAAAARDGADIADARRYAQIGDRRRSLSLSFTRVAGAGIAGVAIDVTDAAQAEAKLQLDLDAYADMLDRLPVAIAVFGKDQRLASYNRAYARMWNFSDDWLATHPTKSDVLDCLREAHALPEQRDFAAWKRDRLQLFENRAAPVEEFRHLADGRSVRVVAQPHLLGGVFFLFEDVSERLRLEASFKMLTQVQKATLDTVEDGIAIFAPDGRLVLHNKAFARLWRLGEDELSGQPHLTKVANLSQARVGHDGIWSIVAAGVTSDEPERCAEWGKAARADGRIISVSMSRLPNGATVVTFADLTDIKRFRSEQAETAHVAA